MENVSIIHYDRVIKMNTSNTREDILNKLKTTKIRVGQIDTNGKCNAACWYCPVKYDGNPKEFAKQTSVEDLRTILSNLRSSTLFPKETQFLYSSHYNEILLYRHFEEMLKLFKEFNFMTMILSNGTPLTPEKIKIINNNKEVVSGICLNIPAIEKSEWARKAGFSENIHRVLLNNLDYLNKNNSGDVTIQVNCSSDVKNLRNLGMYTSPEDLANIVSAFKSKYNTFNVTTNTGLSDRAGKLGDSNAITPLVKIKKIVTGCSHSGNNGGRVFEWIHINSLGDLFICCDDYNMKYRFGNLLDKSFDDIWLSEEHIDQILLARNEICTRCVAAI